MRKVILGIILCVTSLPAAVIAEDRPLPMVGDAPKPAVAPVSWELKFRFEDPQRLSVVVPGRSEPVVYWYMVYSIENPTDAEVEFYPRFDIVTDTLKVVRSEVGVSPEAFRAVFARVGNPLLVAPERAVGRLLRGEDRRRYSVAIWPDFDPAAKAFTVYVAGLSGETARWRNPAFNHAAPENEANPRYFVLRKTLAIPYRFPGSESLRSRSVPERMTDRQEWIMR